LAVVAAVERREAVLKSVVLAAETRRAQRAKVLLAQQAAAGVLHKLVEQTDQAEVVTVFRLRSMGLQHSEPVVVEQVVALWAGLAAVVQARIIRP
jgi:hypothetical protein